LFDTTAEDVGCDWMVASRTVALGLTDGVEVLDGIGVEVATETLAAAAKIARLSTVTGAGLGVRATTTGSFGVAGIGTI
jgi:hypothetical protein